MNSVIATQLYVQKQYTPAIGLNISKLLTLELNHDKNRLIIMLWEAVLPEYSKFIAINEKVQKIFVGKS